MKDVRRLLSPVRARLAHHLDELFATQVQRRLEDTEARLVNSMRAESESLREMVRFGRGMYLGNERALVGHPVASFMYVDTACLLVTPGIIAGTYEKATASMLQHRLSPGMHVLDIGANQGFHTLSMAYHVAPGGKVFAFEPNPRTFPYLEANIASHGLGGTVTLHSQAASDRVGQSEFRQVHGYSAGSYLADLLKEDGRDQLAGRTVEIQTVDIAEFVRSQGREPDLIKIDVEGAEDVILRTLAPTLDPARTDVIIEVNPSLIEAVAGLTNFFELVERLGYKYWAYRENHFLRLEVEEVESLFLEDLLLSTKPLDSTG